MLGESLMFFLVILFVLDFLREDFDFFIYICCIGDIFFRLIQDLGIFKVVEIKER